jgi:hypothetical protein
VLNPNTGMVSPQYHLKYDDTFETIRGIREPEHRIWRQKCYFSDYLRPITAPKLPTNNEVRQRREAATRTGDVRENQPLVEDVPDEPNEVFAAEPVPAADNEPTDVANVEPVVLVGQNKGAAPVLEPVIDQVMETNTEDDREHPARRSKSHSSTISRG